MTKLLQFILIAGALACATTATAQPTSQDQLTIARESFRSGAKKLEAGDYEGALIDYRIADAVVHKPSTRIGVARALVGLGRLVEARHTALSVADIPAPPKEHPTLRRAREAAASLVGALNRRVARAVFIVTPAEAEIVLDRQLLAAAQTDGVDLDPGRHVMRVSAPGHQPQKRAFEVKEGERTRIQVTLLPEPPEIIVPPIVDPGPVFGPITWTGFGATGAGLLIGAVAGGITLSRASELRAICNAGNGNDCLEPEHDERRAALTSAHVATAGFVLAGMGVGVGLAGLLALEQPPEEDVAVTPIIGPGFFGVQGAF